MGNYYMVLDIFSLEKKLWFEYNTRVDLGVHSSALRARSKARTELTKRTEGKDLAWCRVGCAVYRTED